MARGASSVWTAAALGAGSETAAVFSRLSLSSLAVVFFCVVSAGGSLTWLSWGCNLIVLKSAVLTSSTTPGTTDGADTSAPALPVAATSKQTSAPKIRVQRGLAFLYSGQEGMVSSQVMKLARSQGL
jgi:hypothetical protein